MWRAESRERAGLTRPSYAHARQGLTSSIYRLTCERETGTSACVIDNRIMLAIDGIARIGRRTPRLPQAESVTGSTQGAQYAGADHGSAMQIRFPR